VGAADSRASRAVSGRAKLAHGGWAGDAMGETDLPNADGYLDPSQMTYWSGPQASPLRTCSPSILMALAQPTGLPYAFLLARIRSKSIVSIRAPVNELVRGRLGCAERRPADVWRPTERLWRLFLIVSLGSFLMRDAGKFSGQPNPVSAADRGAGVCVCVWGGERRTSWWRAGHSRPKGFESLYRCCRS